MEPPPESEPGEQSGALEGGEGSQGRADRRIRRGKGAGASTRVKRNSFKAGVDFGCRATAGAGTETVSRAGAKDWAGAEAGSGRRSCYVEPKKPGEMPRLEMIRSPSGAIGASGGANGEIRDERRRQQANLDDSEPGRRAHDKEDDSVIPFLNVNCRAISPNAAIDADEEVARHLQKELNEEAASEEAAQRVEVQLACDGADDNTIAARRIQEELWQEESADAPSEDSGHDDPQDIEARCKYPEGQRKNEGKGGNEHDIVLSMYDETYKQRISEGREALWGERKIYGDNPDCHNLAVQIYDEWIEVMKAVGGRLLRRSPGRGALGEEGN
ncbi:hypothetical protein ACHAWF_000875 [Thalassiosira exigua]